MICRYDRGGSKFENNIKVAASCCSSFTAEAICDACRGRYTDSAAIQVNKTRLSPFTETPTEKKISPCSLLFLLKIYKFNDNIISGDNILFYFNYQI